MWIVLDLSTVSWDELRLYKNPDFPIWVLASPTHYTMIFSTQRSDSQLSEEAVQSHAEPCRAAKMLFIRRFWNCRNPTLEGKVESWGSQLAEVRVTQLSQAQESDTHNSWVTSEQWLSQVKNITKQNNHTQNNVFYTKLWRWDFFIAGSFDNDFFRPGAMCCRTYDCTDVKLLWQRVDVLTAACGGELSCELVKFRPEFSRLGAATCFSMCFCKVGSIMLPTLVSVWAGVVAGRHTPPHTPTHPPPHTHPPPPTHPHTHTPTPLPPPHPTPHTHPPTHTHPHTHTHTHTHTPTHTHTHTHTHPHTPTHTPTYTHTHPHTPHTSPHIPTHPHTPTPPHPPPHTHPPTPTPHTPTPPHPPPHTHPHTPTPTHPHRPTHPTHPPTHPHTHTP